MCQPTGIVFMHSLPHWSRSSHHSFQSSRSLRRTCQGILETRSFEETAVMSMNAARTILTVVQLLHVSIPLGRTLAILARPVSTSVPLICLLRVTLSAEHRHANLLEMKLT